MPLMVYTFLKDAIEKHGRPVTTSEVEDYARETLPMCLDHVAHHLVELDRKGLATKRWDEDRKGFVWQITKDYSLKELIEKFPELYGHSIYYHAVAETLGEKIDMEKAMRMLYEISGGSEKRPSVSEIKRKVKEKLQT